MKSTTPETIQSTDKFDQILNSVYRKQAQLAAKLPYESLRKIVRSKLTLCLTIVPVLLVFSKITLALLIGLGARKQIRRIFPGPQTLTVPAEQAVNDHDKQLLQ